MNEFIFFIIAYTEEINNIKDLWENKNKYMTNPIYLEIPYLT